MSETMTVRLHELAHGRAGDKGDRLNVSVIAFDAADYPLLEAQVTAERVAALFDDRRPGRIVRYALPRIAAFNFVLDGVLEGGVNRSLNLDSHGKTLSYRILDLPIEVPAARLAAIRQGKESKGET
ncbi:hypothetical protein SAMN06265365_10510 [Tistlia consotensis]|uniref:AtuA-like ferredoxin-fold domain-containing protein n=1 Tax=Tistlia consotensis USBA 355 TaxID=560819 RepID=A0A1Y6BJX3_9PROT|nr:hypothetical protein [Tistlia consotensis]SMF14697.1 hypothetical protein SAMN05428998_105289 [Tistlia consotensis USBA 355]SNR49321.1 hypothetical protein SAMN06265365_10510 [Tistlia consotensis]